MRTIYFSDVYDINRLHNLPKKISVIDIDDCICGNNKNQAVNYLKYIILSKEIKRNINSKKIFNHIIFLYQFDIETIIKNIKNITNEDIRFVLISSLENVFEYYKKIPKEVIIVEHH